MKVTTLALAVLMAAPLAMAQDAPAATSGGKITVGVLGRDDVESSKFTEYREVPKGDFTIEYVTRFNTAGEFALPATRVEAMYSPEMFGELPNAKVTVLP